MISWTDWRSDDFSPIWPGLNDQLLFDIFCVKKAHEFSFEQGAEYNFTDFIEDINRAEQYQCLGNVEIAKRAGRYAFKRKVDKISFHPRWLIDDDLFSTMQWTFAASSFVNKLQEQSHTAQGAFNIQVYIISERMVSMYDHSLDYHIEIPWELIKKTALSWCCHTVQPADCKSIFAKSKLFGNLYNKTSVVSGLDEDILIFVDKQKSSQNAGKEVVGMFAFENVPEFLESSGVFHKMIGTLFFGFEFKVDNMVKTWLRIDGGQRIRFFPEFLVSLIPHFFVSPENLDAATYLNKIYAEIKNQWTVHLDDSTFNLYYKAITGDDHISNNYLRGKMQMDDRMERTFGFWEYLRRRTDPECFRNVYPLLLKHDMDSDAVFYDLLEIQKDGRVFVDEDDSNLMVEMDTKTASQFKLTAFRWKNIDCGPARDGALDLRDCKYINTAIHYLVAFENYEHKVNASNLWEFDLGEMIESFDHITTAHELLTPERRAEIQRYVSIHVACVDLINCDVLRKSADRRRGRERQRDTGDEEYLDSIERECIIIVDIMWSLHSFLLHRDHTLQNDVRGARFEHTEEKHNEENTSETNTTLLMQQNDQEGDTTNAIDFGVTVLRWLPFAESPHFTSFREEITRNPDSTITEEIFEQFLIECYEKIRNSMFTLKEMLALKLFTDCTKFQSYFRKAHWATTSLSTKKMYYFWGSALYEAALYHSVPIPSVDGTNPMALYHGVNKMFTVDADIPKYNGPFSSTTARSVAHHFTNEQGLFFKMQPSYANKLKRCIGIKVESISCHKHEREILLVDQFLPITTAKTFKNSDSALVDYLIFSLKGWNSEIRNRDQFYRQIGIRFVPSWMPLIEAHFCLFEVSKFNGRLVIYRLIVELDILVMSWVPRLVHERINGQPAIVMLVERWKVRQLLPVYRVLTSKFKVIRSARMDLSFLSFASNTKMDYIGDDDIGNDSCFEESEYKINKVPVAHTASTFAGMIERIECHHSIFSGDKPIWIQEFADTELHELSNDEIVKFIEDNQAIRLLPHYRVLTSRFDVIQCRSLNMSFLKFMPNIKLDHFGVTAGFATVNDLIFEETEYEINGVFVPYDTSTVKAIVREIECRNSKLFGDKTIWIQKFSVPENQSMVEEIVNLVEQHEVKQLLPHYRVLTSKFRVIQSHLLNKCFKIELLPNTKMDHVGDMDCISNSCFEETEYKADGKYILPFDIPIGLMNGVIHRVSCRNIKLFGDKDIWIQNFDAPEDDDALFAEVIDLVENHCITQLLPHYRVLTSKFKFRMNLSQSNVNESQIEFIPNTKMDHLVDEKTLDESCFEETEYKVNGLHVIPHTMSTVHEFVYRIECRNTSLFGNRLVWNQVFQEQLQRMLVGQVQQMALGQGIETSFIEEDEFANDKMSKFRHRTLRNLHDDIVDELMDKYEDLEEYEDTDSSDDVKENGDGELETKSKFELLMDRVASEFLFGVLMESMKAMKERKSKICQMILRQLHVQDNDDQTVEQTVATAIHPQLQQQWEFYFNLEMENQHEIDLPDIYTVVDGIYDVVIDKEPYSSWTFLNEKKLKRYIKECAEICWIMILMKPELSFHPTSFRSVHRYNERDKHDLWEGSKTKNGAQTVYFAVPAILQKHLVNKENVLQVLPGQLFAHNDQSVIDYVISDPDELLKNN